MFVFLTFKVHGSVGAKSPVHNYESEIDESSSSSIVTSGTQSPPSNRTAESKLRLVSSNSELNATNQSKRLNKATSNQDFNCNSNLIQFPSTSSILHSSQSISISSMNPSATGSSNAFIGPSQQHPFLYHPSTPNEWYNSSGNSSNHDTIAHFGHHHHLLHHGPATAY